MKNRVTVCVDNVYNLNISFCALGQQFYRTLNGGGVYKGVLSNLSLINLKNSWFQGF